METSSRFAANAYQTLAKVKDALNEQKSQTLGKIVGGDDKEGAFGNMVTSAISGFASQAREADQQAASMAAGKTDLVDVVTAVAETQVAMETLVSVRDQVISAYEKILQMPI